MTGHNNSTFGIYFWVKCDFAGPVREHDPRHSAATIAYISIAECECISPTN